MTRSRNPIKRALVAVGLVLARFGLMDRHRVERATDLSWPRIVTGLARRSKSAADVAMIGIAVGPAAIAGIGFAGPFWALSFAFGGGIAGGTIAMVSQRYGAERYDELAVVVRGSAIVVALLSLPLAALFWAIPELLIEVVGSEQPAILEGTAYLQVVAFGVPFAALNLVWSRTLVGCDDAWTPMVVRAGGAVVNIAVNAVLIFGLDLGVVGAALGTVLGDFAVTAAFVIGLVRGRLPFVGEFPVRVPVRGRYLDLDVVRDLLEIGTPLLFARLARTSARFPKIFLIGLFGANAVAAYVIAMRVRGLMATPGYGFGLASSSLVGQALGTGDEGEATAWARDVLRFSVAVYAFVAGTVVVFAEQVGRLFVEDPAILPLVTVFIYAACLSNVFRGIDTGATGPLRASGDTRWPLYAQLAGRYVAALPIIYVGVATPIGIAAVYAAIVAEMLVPAAITYYRYRSGTWLRISRRYRPDTAASD